MLKKLNKRIADNAPVLGLVACGIVVVAYVKLTDGILANNAEYYKQLLVKAVEYADKAADVAEAA